MTGYYIYFARKVVSIRRRYANHVVSAKTYFGYIFKDIDNKFIYRVLKNGNVYFEHMVNEIYPNELLLRRKSMLSLGNQINPYV